MGDSVLSLVVSNYIFCNCPNLPEGELTKLRASLVCEKSLFKFAKMINLRKYLRFTEPEILNHKTQSIKDYKTNLQEIVQKNPGELLEYVLISESGPDHNKHFVVEVHLNSNVLGRGGGKSKKEAEQQAAREALALMGY